MFGRHSQQGGIYHYDFPPNCIITDAEARNPTVTGHYAQIGWVFNGFPVYGLVHFTPAALMLLR